MASSSEDPINARRPNITGQEVIFAGQGGAPNVRDYFGIVFKYPLEKETIPILPVSEEPYRS